MLRCLCDAIRPHAEGRAEQFLALYLRDVLAGIGKVHWHPVIALKQEFGAQIVGPEKAICSTRPGAPITAIVRGARTMAIRSAG